MTDPIARALRIAYASGGRAPALLPAHLGQAVSIAGVGRFHSALGLRARPRFGDGGDVRPAWMTNLPADWTDGDPVPAAPVAPAHGGGMSVPQALWAEAKNIGSGVASAATLPGDVYAGRASMSDPDTIKRALDLAAMIPAAGLGAEAEAPNLLASRTASLYDPPAKPPRAFEADYPSGASADAAGHLTHDIDGRPLNPEAIIAGRRVVGVPDTGLEPGDVQQVGDTLLGSPPRRISSTAIGGNAGRVVFDQLPTLGAATGRIDLASSLNATQSARVLGHETGHVIDDIAGQIDPKGLTAELRDVYNALNNGMRNAAGTDVRANARTFGPQHAGYKGDDVPREMMAEAIRAYMADPNYLKTVAPKTAAAIRAAVNDNPRLSGAIQFNAGSLGALPSQDDGGFARGGRIDPIARALHTARSLPGRPHFDDGGDASDGSDRSQAAQSNNNDPSSGGWSSGAASGNESVGSSGMPSGGNSGGGLGGGIGGGYGGSSERSGLGSMGSASTPGTSNGAEQTTGAGLSGGYATQGAQSVTGGDFTGRDATPGSLTSQLSGGFGAASQGPQKSGFGSFGGTGTGTSGIGSTPAVTSQSVSGTSDPLGASGGTFGSMLGARAAAEAAAGPSMESYGGWGPAALAKSGLSGGGDESGATTVATSPAGFAQMAAMGGIPGAKVSVVSDDRPGVYSFTGSAGTFGGDATGDPASVGGERALTVHTPDTGFGFSAFGEPNAGLVGPIGGYQPGSISPIGSSAAVGGPGFDNFGLSSNALTASISGLPNTWAPPGWSPQAELSDMITSPGDYFGDKYSSLKNFHPTPAFASGLLGNFSVESGGYSPSDPTGIVTNALNPESKALGMAQDLGPRQRGLLSALGMDPHMDSYQASLKIGPDTLSDQLGYNLNEVASGQYPGTLAAALNPNATPADIARTVMSEFEAPSPKEQRQSIKNRLASTSAWGSELGDAQAEANAAAANGLTSIGSAYNYSTPATLTATPSEPVQASLPSDAAWSAGAEPTMPSVAAIATVPHSLPGFADPGDMTSVQNAIAIARGLGEPAFTGAIMAHPGFQFTGAPVSTEPSSYAPDTSLPATGPSITVGPQAAPAAAPSLYTSAKPAADDSLGTKVAAGAINTAAGLIPGVGLINGASSLFGGPNIGSLIAHNATPGTSDASGHSSKWSTRDLQSSGGDPGAGTPSASSSGSGVPSLPTSNNLDPFALAQAAYLAAIKNMPVDTTFQRSHAVPLTVPAHQTPLIYDAWNDPATQAALAAAARVRS